MNVSRRLQPVYFRPPEIEYYKIWAKCPELLDSSPPVRCRSANVHTGLTFQEPRYGSKNSAMVICHQDPQHRLPPYRYYADSSTRPQYRFACNFPIGLW